MFFILTHNNKIITIDMSLNTYQTIGQIKEAYSLDRLTNSMGKEITSFDVINKNTTLYERSVILGGGHPVTNARERRFKEKAKKSGHSIKYERKKYWAEQAKWDEKNKCCAIF